MLNCLLGKRFATVLRTTFPIILHGVIKKNQDQLMNFISFLFFWFKMTQKRWNHNKKKKNENNRKSTLWKTEPRFFLMPMISGSIQSLWWQSCEIDHVIGVYRDDCGMRSLDALQIAKHFNHIHLMGFENSLLLLLNISLVWLRMRKAMPNELQLYLSCSCNRIQNVLVE